jgi:hypothetical protein
MPHKALAKCGQIKFARGNNAKGYKMARIYKQETDYILLAQCIQNPYSGKVARRPVFGGDNPECYFVSDGHSFAEAVSKKLNEGYSLYGSPFTDGKGYIFQAMVKYAEQKQAQK